MKAEGLAVLGAEKDGTRTSVKLLITYDNDPHATKIPSRFQTATLAWRGEVNLRTRPTAAFSSPRSPAGPRGTPRCCAMVASMRRRRASSVAQAMCGVIRQSGRRKQRVVGPDRLDGDDIQRGAGQPARVQRLGQVLLDDQRPARRVDQERGRLDAGRADRD